MTLSDLLEKTKGHAMSYSMHPLWGLSMPIVLMLVGIFRSTGNIEAGIALWLLVTANVVRAWIWVSAGKLPWSVMVLSSAAYLCNGTVVWANGGHMPALCTAKLLRDAGPVYIALTADTPFWYLGDLIGRVSIGDLCIGGALAALIASTIVRKLIP